MSKLAAPTTQPGFASRTAFAALGVEGGDDTDEDVESVEEPTTSAAERFVHFKFVHLCIFVHVPAAQNLRE